jgi:hypothetical protein
LKRKERSIRDERNGVWKGNGVDPFISTVEKTARVVEVCPIDKNSP